MFCQNCGKKISQTASFCPGCGEEVKHSSKRKSKKDSGSEEKKGINPLIVIGAIIGGFILLVILGSIGSNNSGGIISTSSAKSKLGSYLEKNGYTKVNDNLYTNFENEYIYKFDFSNELMSIENDTTYSGYYYKKELASVRTITSSGTVSYTYNFKTDYYDCSTVPSTSQTYVCAYLKSKALELANTMRNSFNTVVTSAGVAASDL